jgi:uncharacterized SAM-binding protein YcdF (DUF218 family)
MFSMKNGENSPTGNILRTVLCMTAAAVLFAAAITIKSIFAVAGMIETLLCAAGIIVVIYWVFSMLRLKGWKPAKILIRIMAALVAIGFVYFAVVEIILVQGAHSDVGKTDYIIVLGAGVDGTVPSLSLQYRLDAALEYMNANPDAIAVVSGGKGLLEDISEADCMYNWLTKHGISSGRIIKEEHAVSTEQNIKNSLQLIGDGDYQIGIVTAEYHVFRAKEVAEKNGVVSPIGISAKTQLPWLRANYFIREAFAVTAFWVFG